LAQVVYSQSALEDVEGAFEFLVSVDPRAAAAAAGVIRSGVALLSTHPLIGRPVTQGLRELVISYGKNGYVALYRYRPERDEVRVLAIRHQRQIDYRY
jgi:plasmid stabilization system protein ParE